jgi:hypothetical protein
MPKTMQTQPKLIVSAMRALRLAGRKTSAKYAVPMPVIGNAISPANCQKLAGSVFITSTSLKKMNAFPAISAASRTVRAPSDMIIPAHQALRSRFGSLAIIVAIRRATSLLSNLAAESPGPRPRKWFGTRNQLAVPITQDFTDRTVQA